MKFHKDSEVKTRYALAVLRVAQSVDRESAARLIRGLARDFPHPEERHEVSALHFEAIEAFEDLAESPSSFQRRHRFLADGHAPRSSG